MAPIVRSSIALAALLALVGCGASGLTTPRHTLANPAGLAMNPQALRQLPARGPSGPAADHGQGMQILGHVRQVLGGAKGFSAELMSNTEGHWKQGEYTQELRHVAEGFRIVWLKPAKFRAVVFNAPSPIMEGATLVTTDGVHCSAKAQGLLGFLTVHADANDKRIANARNHTFDKFAPSAQMNRLTGPSAVWTVLDQTPGPSGAPIVRVRVDNVPRLDKEIDEEQLTIDLGTSALKSMIALVRGHTVVSYTFSKFAWNPKTTADMFEL